MSEKQKEKSEKEVDDSSKSTTENKDSKALKVTTKESLPNDEKNEKCDILSCELPHVHILI